MGMNVGSGSGSSDVMVEMNTTPLIDLMLVLIVMLIMSLPPQTHAVKLDMPVTNNPPPDVPPPVIDIVVDFDGSIYWNSEVIASGEQLKSYMRSAAHAEPRPEKYFHLPSGTKRAPNARLLLGPGAVINPQKLLKEIAEKIHSMLSNELLGCNKKKHNR